FDPVILDVRLAEQIHPGLVVTREAGLARVAGTDRGRRRASREPAGLHGVHDPAAREWIHHMRRVAANHYAVGMRALEGVMHDHPAHRVAGPGPARVAAGDPLVEVLAGITAVALQRDDAQPDVG